MTELLFEGYGVPSLAYGIDALFSAHHHWTRRGVALRDALVISSGQQTTHLIPLLDGRIDSEHCKRYLHKSKGGKPHPSSKISSYTVLAHTHTHTPQD